MVAHLVCEKDMMECINQIYISFILLLPAVKTMQKSFVWFTMSLLARQLGILNDGQESVVNYCSLQFYHYNVYYLESLKILSFLR